MLYKDYRNNKYVRNLCSAIHSLCSATVESGLREIVAVEPIVPSIGEFKQAGIVEVVTLLILMSDSPCKSMG